MSVLYERIDQLCRERNINITTMCKESGASRSSLTDLKSGRKQNLSVETLTKIATYFQVSVDYLTGVAKEKAPTATGERHDVLDEVDVAFYGEFKELDEDQKATIRDMVAVMRQRKEKRAK